MHEQFLLAALEQAKLGQGSCAPNPSVGAVAVQNGKIIAQAWHHGAGNPHAEQLLLSQFPANTPGVSVYVTLEPCNHWGRTPPCIDAIIQHGIEQVIYGYSDPNPLVKKNNSPEMLERKGVKSIFLPLAEIELFYQSYSYWVKTGHPRVTVKIAQTLDGKIAGAKGERLQLSNSSCNIFTHELRRKADVLLTTARTINQDDPQFTLRLENKIEGKNLAVLDRNLTLNPDAKALHLAKHCHIFCAENLSCFQHPSCSVHPTSVKNNTLDLVEIIQQLGRLGYHDILVEAGGKLFSALHHAGLVHKTYIYIVPQVLSVEAVSAYPMDAIFKQAAQISWKEMDDNMILCLDWQQGKTCLQV